MAVAMNFVERAAVGATRQLHTSDSKSIVSHRYIDGAGHSRSLYRGLALYALETMKELPSGSIDQLSASCAETFNAFIESSTPPPASDGSRIVGLAFDAMAIACSSVNTPAVQTSRRVLEQIAIRQQPDGTFLSRTDSDNPEPRWYHELALLHAVSTFAYRTQNQLARDAALRAAIYQAEQIQPDHASSHPFALHAFLRSENGTFLADMMLHAAGVQQPSTMDTVSLLLLADALDCMRRSNW